ncbi:MAG: metallophosphoesterase [Bacilli bacterium]
MKYSIIEDELSGSYTMIPDENINYYAISDIHGNLDAFKDALSNIDRECDNTRLILLGDYIDGGKQSCEVLKYIRDLKNIYKDKIIVLMGNHEETFLEWLDDPEYMVSTFISNIDTIMKFLSEMQLKTLNTTPNNNEEYINMSKLCAKYILSNHSSLICWTRNLPRYFETDSQIYVHAGIDERGCEKENRYWKNKTQDFYFTNKFPPTNGKFYKDIIAGHVSTALLASDQAFNEIYYDGESHYYIDGNVLKTGKLPVLKYCKRTKSYTGFKNIKINNKFIWEEYEIEEHQNKEYFKSQKIKLKD